MYCRSMLGNDGKLGQFSCVFRFVGRRVFGEHLGCCHFDQRYDRKRDLFVQLRLMVSRIAVMRLGSIAMPCARHDVECWRLILRRQHHSDEFRFIGERRISGLYWQRDL